MIGNIYYDWFTGDDRINRGAKNRFLYQIGGVPFVGDVVRMYDADRYMSDYLSNRGLDWADIKYPSIAKGSTNTIGGLWKTSEKSLKALYR